ncbi:UBA/TS-N domain containing protein [Histomonas meleagridis]|uniref:UBA/TS-N domain containing protein n=1 Tax=Histomonas meleagridis TaxID=135588 RepID=UPI003559FAE3|nr:UBA/TS-N domain containing protein [Histomonas meleagridis]KAH0798061.1 UBA/TS-N domain containing protein [Histomonas meleagridis]
MKALFQLGSQTLDLDVSQDETVANVKGRLSEILRANPNDIDLYINSNKLTDDSLFCKAYDEPLLLVNVYINDQVEDEEEEDFDLEISNQVETPSFTPEGMEEQIKNLMALGSYSHELCEQALRMSYFNTDKAAEFLLSGNVPETPPIDLYYNDESYPFLPLSEYDKEFIRDLTTNGYDFGSVIQCLNVCGYNHEGTLQLLQTIY